MKIQCSRDDYLDFKVKIHNAVHAHHLLQQAHQLPRHPETLQKPQKETERLRILFIGDSISANIDINALENATQKWFVTAKAYSSVYDTVTNAAKKAARFPNSNFTDAIPAQLRKSKFHSLILQAGSVD